MPDFYDWMEQCDEICVQRIGIGIHDMPDLLWRDMYEDELSPSAAVDDAIDYWIVEGDLPPDLL